MSLHTLLVSTLPLAGLGILWSLGSSPKAQTIAAEEGGQVDEGPTENVRWQGSAAEEIKHRLTPLQYTVTQEAGTEPPFRNPYWDNRQDGIYVDVVSGEPLFSSREKFESGTGWPSFHSPLNPDLIVEREDRKLGMMRTEVRSRHGGSHLGHVFDDGPTPTGLRYCIIRPPCALSPWQTWSRRAMATMLHCSKTKNRWPTANEPDPAPNDRAAYETPADGYRSSPQIPAPVHRLR